MEHNELRYSDQSTVRKKNPCKFSIDEVKTILLQNKDDISSGKAISSTEAEQLIAQLLKES